MQIIVNGKVKEVRDGISLNDFIGFMLKVEKGKIIELNGNVIKKTERENIPLKDGDRIEIIQFMGGG